MNMDEAYGQITSRLLRYLEHVVAGEQVQVIQAICLVKQEHRERSPILIMIAEALERGESNLSI